MELLVGIQKKAAEEVRQKIQQKRAEIVEQKNKVRESREHTTPTAEQVELESKLESKMRGKKENKPLQLKIELQRVVEVRAHACVYIGILNWSRRGVTWHTTPMHVPVALLHAFTVTLVVFFSEHTRRLGRTGWITCAYTRVRVDTQPSNHIHNLRETSILVRKKSSNFQKSSSKNI